ncbi:MAG: hypothetical protein HOB58_09880 [Nitrospina sp.]|nr:hypothetical protein [Nitrospina sp.]
MNGQDVMRLSFIKRIMPREIHADVNAGFTLVECNREIDEREAQAAKR